jgi:hypothetical protein
MLRLEFPAEFLSGLSVKEMFGDQFVELAIAMREDRRLGERAENLQLDEVDVITSNVARWMEQTGEVVELLRLSDGEEYVKWIFRTRLRECERLEEQLKGRIGIEAYPPLYKSETV